jgi:chromosomal replication initiator protein
MAREIWNKILSIARKKISAAQFDTWLKPLNFIKIENDVVLISTPNPLARDFVENEFKDLFDDIIKELQIKGLSISFVESSSSNPPEELFLQQQKVEKENIIVLPESSGMSLNYNYTFENFVPAHTNEFAHAACLAVSQDSPAKQYNPLYIYGGVGLGKTHLLQSVAHEFLKRSKKIKTVYLSAERFMNEMISSIGNKRQQEFREKYRKIDVLILDDVQILRDKTATQEELFHTFNSLYEDQKQIVISSDCNPTELQGVADRLRSRFAWGLIAEIQPPDLETKIAILHKKAEARNVSVPDSVASYIASRVTSNIRELEGCLTKLIAFSNFKGRAISMDLASEALQNQFEASNRFLTVEAIQKLIAASYKLKVNDIKAKSNKAEIVLPRQIAMYLCKEILGISLPEIGRKFGGKHHSTVLHSIRKIEDKIAGDKAFQQHIQNFTRSLR